MSPVRTFGGHLEEVVAVLVEVLELLSVLLFVLDLLIALDLRQREVREAILVS